MNLWSVFRRRRDYRASLFGDLLCRLNGVYPRRILEIGPRDGKDTMRLVSLGANELVLVDLPSKQDKIEKWLPALAHEPVRMIFGNINTTILDGTFDLVWCTGVLYHNQEQLRLLRKLFSLLNPGGHLVLETATARRHGLRNENCVEIWYPPNKDRSGSYHLSVNITHLPSRLAVESWLKMAGFVDIERSRCYHRPLAASRVAYISKKEAA